MNSKLCFIAVALAVLSIASARVPRDAPKDDAFSFSQFADTAEKNLQEFQDNLLKLFGVKNTDELKDKAVDSGKQFAEKLDVWAKDIKKEADSLADSKAVKDLRSSVDKAIEEFNLKHPETAADVKEYVSKANKGTEEVIAKLKALSESSDAQNVKDAAKKLADSAAETFQKIIKEAQEAVKKQ